MKELLSEIENVEKEIKKIQEDYAKECVDLYNKKDFDYYKPKWQRKIDKIAGKYADLLIPLHDKHNELRKEANIREEEIRKSKYK